MRSPLGKECRKLFLKMMAVQFPEYHEDKTQITPQGRWVWTQQHPSGIWFHTLLVTHSMHDKFTVEAAWGFDGKLPRPMYGTGDYFSQPWLFRPGFIWSGKDHWWLVVLRPDEHERVIFYKDDPVEQCLALIAPAVWDAGEKIKEHVVPLFEKIILKHGIAPT